VFVVHEEAPKSIQTADSEKVKNVNCCEFNVSVGSGKSIPLSSKYNKRTYECHFAQMEFRMKLVTDTHYLQC
jgi:hypothetical protein